MLQIYNSITKKKEEFKPINPPKVGLYCCGVTVYADCHIGHARTFLVFDMVVRYLKFLGYEVNYIRNITDVDDKIIFNANKLGVTCSEISDKYISSMHSDFAKMNLLSPDAEPRATDYIDNMISMIKVLINKKHAYVGANGDVFFDISSYPDYGELSNRNIEDMLSGIRVKANEAKKNSLDFVLWKLAKPGEPSWGSPWGDGRPGWHIECSAMSHDLLGATFDLHGGGHDLQFPHHENECAQSKAATGEKFAKSWMHVGFLQVESEKMSKSLNNFITIKDILSKYHPEVLRILLLGGHYRKPLDFSMDSLNRAKSSLDRLYFSVKDIEFNSDFKLDFKDQYVASFIEAMNDDFNTPQAIACLYELAKKVNKSKSENDFKNAIMYANILIKLAQVLGIMHDENYFKQDDDTVIQDLIDARDKARAQKDWELADKIRGKLKSMNVVLTDLEGKTTWHRE